jgi:SpoVK/Ycf46/Vps4 family AAA+-type ATPase
MSSTAARFAEQIDLLVRARYPALYVVTFEEGRLEHLLFELARRQGKPFAVWTATRGLRSLGVREQAGAELPHYPTPSEVLEHIRAERGAGIYLLEDLHLHFDDPQVVRRLRDVAAELKNSHKTVVLSAARMALPPELEKDLTVLDLPLPDEAEIAALLRSLCEQLSQRDPKSVALSREDSRSLVRAARGLTLAEAENAFAKAAVYGDRLDAGDIQLVMEEKRQAIRKSGVLDFHPAEATLEDVGGLEPLKDWLRRRGKALLPGAREFGLEVPKGVLLLGVPGCGKSLSAQVIAHSWGLPLLHLDLGRVFSGLLGSSEDNMRKALQAAEAVAPAVLWVDEIEKGLAGGNGSSQSDGGTAQRVFASLLTWMQEQRAGVFVAATANRIDALPPELLRRGRFDEIFFVDLPAAAARAEILSIHLRKRGRDPSLFALADLAKACDGYSGAEIEQALVEALFAAFDRGSELEGEDIARAIADTTPLSVTSAEAIGAMRAWAKTRARSADRPTPEPVRSFVGRARG